MQMVCVNKTQFAGLNDKRFYFHDGIVSLPFGHFLLNKVREQKEKYKMEIQYEIHDKNYDFLKEEAAAVKQCERLHILRSIFSQRTWLCLLHLNILMRIPSINSTRDYILNSNWNKNMEKKHLRYAVLRERFDCWKDRLWKNTFCTEIRSK